MTMSLLTRRCPICSKTATNVLAALWSHLKPVDLSRDNFATARGTFKMFGAESVLCNFSPLYNCLRHWRVRKMELKFPNKFDGGCVL